MNSTPTLEETFGECLKQWLEHKNMNSEPLYTSQSHAENIAKIITTKTCT